MSTNRNLADMLAKAQKRKDDEREETIDLAVMRISTVLLGHYLGRWFRRSAPRAYGVACVVMGAIVSYGGILIYKKEKAS